MSDIESLRNNKHIPESGSRCTDVLSDTLEGYSGIHQAEFDIENGKLKISYDPRLLTREQAIHILGRSGKQAAARVMQCRAKSLTQCAACSGQMGDELAYHYNQLADGTNIRTKFHVGNKGGLIEVLLNQPGFIGHESIVEETMPQQDQTAPAWRGLPREQVEVVLTGLNALFGVTAFLFAGSASASPAAWIMWSLSYIAGGYYGLLDGLEALREKKLDVNLLMILAALGAAAIGSPAEGAILLFLFSLSNTLQSFAMDRSRKAIEKLLDLRPPTANVRRGSRIITLPVEKLMLDDTIIVRPGERLPIDGDIITGSSEINQASITGESMPVHKESGEPVFAGTVNGNGALEIRVTRMAKETTLARIVKMVEEAQGSKAQTQRMLDNFEQVYAIIVLGGAALLIVVPVFIMQQPFYPMFYRAMTWLVVASPCALVISTPASILSAIANGARHGILFKGGVHLEKTASLKVVAFDKTGTLTTGKPQVVTVHPFNGLSEHELLRGVAAVESRSEHPLASAVVTAAEKRGIHLPVATDTRAVPGQGVEGRVENRVIWAGGRRMFYERGIRLPPELIVKIDEMENAAQTVIVVYSGGEFLGLLGAADTLRSDAHVMIDAIKQQGIDHVVMLTGDNEQVAAQIAQQAGVDSFHANLLPQDKVRMLKVLKEKYGPIAMVGDGVNDAPALATADVGVAVGGAGTDVALETADVVLLSGDLRKLAHAVGLARSARRIVFQNLTFALAVIVLLVISSFGAQLPLPLGVVGHEGSTVLVVLNGLRLLGYRQS